MGRTRGLGRKLVSGGIAVIKAQAQEPHFAHELTVFFSGCYRHEAGRGSSVVQQPIRKL